MKPTDAFLDLVGSFTGYQPRPITPPPPTGRPVDGSYIVNAEVAPGTYLLTGQDLFWLRLGDINGDVVIDSDSGNGQLVIIVEPTDFSLFLKGVLLPG